MMPGRLCIFLASGFLLMLGCSRPKSFEAGKALSAENYDSLLLQLAPYVIKKPDGMSYPERFESRNRHFYTNYLELTNARIRYYLKADTAEFFSFEHRDLTSLYEHYRALGGYLKRDPLSGKIHFLNLLYHTPRFEMEEMDAKGQVLFMEMVRSGNVNGFIGDKNYIHTPNDDFYYDTKRNMWDYTPNSSWKFLEEAREKAGPGRRDSLN